MEWRLNSLITLSDKIELDQFTVAYRITKLFGIKDYVLID